MSESRFDWYERVAVSTADPNKAVINGRSGVVLGKAQNDDGSWSYAVSIDSLRHTWSFCEEELSSTGAFADPKEYFDGAVIRVSQRGEILG